MPTSEGWERTWQVRAGGARPEAGRVLSAQSCRTTWEVISEATDSSPKPAKVIFPHLVEGARKRQPMHKVQE